MLWNSKLKLRKINTLFKQATLIHYIKLYTKEMKVKCLIIDDEPLAINVIKNYIEQIDEVHVTMMVLGVNVKRIAEEVNYASSWQVVGRG